jgi:quinol monooxygenase YgiN
VVYVVVTNQIREGRMADFLAACKIVQPKVLAEKGCIAYDYIREIASPLGAQEPVDDQRVTLVEKWESLDALAAHGQAPHVKEFGASVRDLREKVTIRVGEPIFGQ